MTWEWERAHARMNLARFNREPAEVLYPLMCDLAYALARGGQTAAGADVRRTANLLRPTFGLHAEHQPRRWFGLRKARPVDYAARVALYRALQPDDADVEL